MAELDIPVLLPEMSVCMDNGAMIAGAGYSRLMSGEFSSLSTTPTPSISL